MAEEKEDLKDEPKSKEKKSPLMLIVIILLVVILLGGAGAGYFLFIAPKDKDTKKGDASSQGQALHQPVQKSYPIAPRGAFAGAIGPIKDLDTFIVNLTDAQGTRYLKVTIRLEMSSELLATEIDEKMAQVRDEIIMLLSSKSFDDISTIAGKRALKREIINGVNKYLSTGQVLRVYFSEFVIQ
ncbi:MAG: flagellar basal body-associated FliL family protein [Deltaproteobacteria bacterium]|nr:flagellar basal body-associated FliL family protein [Deltaproteobacteria bacterium]